MKEVFPVETSARVSISGSAPPALRDAEMPLSPSGPIESSTEIAVGAEGKRVIFINNEFLLAGLVFIMPPTPIPSFYECVRHLV